MSRFGQDMLASEQSLSGLLVERIVTKHGLAIDYGGKIAHEWFTQCPNSLFKEWYAQNLKLGRIRMVKGSITVEHKRALQVKLGFPKRGYDLIYVKVANDTQIKYIISEDLDFYDPKHKLSNHEKWEKLKRERNCAVCFYLKTRMNITVGTPVHADAELFPKTPPPEEVPERPAE
jgi:hypothetical protein